MKHVDHMVRSWLSLAPSLLVLAAACGDARSPAGGDAALDDGGARDDAALAPDGAIAPGWNAPFAVDPAALGLVGAVTWDFTETPASGAAITAAGTFEDASAPSAPVSGPGVGRARFVTGDSTDGAAWILRAAAGQQTRRIYFRDMVALSSPYAASSGREAYFTAVQRLVGGGTVGQSTIDIAKVMAPTTEAEALAVPLRLSVGVQTPNGPSYPQTAGPELTRGTWHQLEALLVANTPNVADGVARVWLDGVLVIDRANLNWASVNGDIYWSEVVWTDRRGTTALPLPAGGQHRDHDHLQVFWSTTRE